MSDKIRELKDKVKQTTSEIRSLQTQLIKLENELQSLYVEQSLGKYYKVGDKYAKVIGRSYSNGINTVTVTELGIAFLSYDKGILEDEITEEEFEEQYYKVLAQIEKS